MIAPLRHILPALFLLGFAAASPVDHLTPVGLRTEGKINPIAVPKKPQLNWRLEAGDARDVMQSAWHILVASDPKLLEPDKADLWDSGKTESDRSPLISYKGKALKTGQLCHWKVRIWDLKDNPGNWSEVATFEVAPTAPEDWSGAEWIFDGKANPTKDEDFYKLDPAPLFRKEFKLEKPIKQARLHVVGLGLCLPSLNGERIEDHILDPRLMQFRQTCCDPVADDVAGVGNRHAVQVRAR